MFNSVDSKHGTGPWCSIALYSEDLPMSLRGKDGVLVSGAGAGAGTGVTCLICIPQSLQPRGHSEREKADDAYRGLLAMQADSNDA